MACVSISLRTQMEAFELSVTRKSVSATCRRSVRMGLKVKKKNEKDTKNVFPSKRAGFEHVVLIPGSM